jgi:hypothetical protein
MLFAGLVPLAAGGRGGLADALDKGALGGAERFDRFRASERRAEIVDLVGRIDGLSSASRRRRPSASRSRCSSMDDLAAGDVVRSFRMTIQLLRQVFHASRAATPCRRRCGAIDRSTATSWTRRPRARLTRPCSKLPPPGLVGRPARVACLPPMRYVARERSAMPRRTVVVLSTPTSQRRGRWLRFAMTSFPCDFAAAAEQPPTELCWWATCSTSPPGIRFDWDGRRSFQRDPQSPRVRPVVDAPGVFRTRAQVTVLAAITTQNCCSPASAGLRTKRLVGRDTAGPTTPRSRRTRRPPAIWGDASLPGRTSPGSSRDRWDPHNQTARTQAQAAAGGAPICRSDRTSSSRCCPPCSRHGSRAEAGGSGCLLLPYPTPPARCSSSRSTSGSTPPSCAASSVGCCGRPGSGIRSIA